MYVCLYVCMYVCIYACVCVCACVCAVMWHSDLLTHATTICLHVEPDYMTGMKLCKIKPARSTYAPVVLRVDGWGVKENFLQKIDMCFVLKWNSSNRLSIPQFPSRLPSLCALSFIPSPLRARRNSSASPTLVYSHHPCNALLWRRLVLGQHH